MILRGALLCLVLLAGCELDPLSEHLDRGAAADLDAAAEAGSDGPASPCPSAPHTKNVYSSTVAGFYASIALGPGSGELHISHRDSIADKVLHTWRSNGAWSTAPIQDVKGLGLYTSIARAPDGKVHAVYGDFKAARLVHSVFSGGKWGAHQAVTGVDNGAMELAVGQGTDLHLVGHHQKAVRYLRRRSGKWQDLTELEASADRFSEVALAVDSGGAVHVALCDTAGRLRYLSGAPGAVKAVKQWDAKLVSWCVMDLAVDPDGGVHIVYASKDNTMVRYLERKGSAWSAPFDLGPTGDVGVLGGVAVRARKDDLWVATATATGLLVARRKAGTWGKPVRMPHGSGKYTTAAVSADGTLHVAHNAMMSSGQGLHYTRVCP